MEEQGRNGGGGVIEDISAMFVQVHITVSCTPMLISL